MEKNNQNPGCNIHAFRVALHELLDPTNTQIREEALEDAMVKQSLEGFIMAGDGRRKDFINTLIDGYKKNIVDQGVDVVWNGINPNSEKSHLAQQEKQLRENFARLSNQNKDNIHPQLSVSIAAYDITTSLSRTLADEKKAMLSSMTYTEVCFLVEKCRGKEFSSLTA